MNSRFLVLTLVLAVIPSAGRAQSLAVHGEVVHTMSGAPIRDGIVVITDGKIAAVGAAGDVTVPNGYEVLKAKVVTPGLVDAHSVIGLAGMLNSDHDQDQLESSKPIQPQLRAIDAYNAHDELIAWVRSFGVTTVHTGHAPGELISGQTLIVKTVGNTIEGAVLNPARAVACSLTSAAQKSGSQSPGNRAKMISMLREELIAAQEYADKHALAAKADDKEPPARDLKLDTLTDVLSGKLRLMITADRAQDINSALRLAEEFKLKIWLDSAAESFLLIDEIKAAGVPVIIHPTMARATAGRENLSFETASKLVQAGIPVALQSGYESYVPKTRVALFEAALAAANGLTFEQALATITRDAAKILEIDDRVGSLAVGKDGDVALYDGDPFEYTTHCVGVVIDGRVVSRLKR